jgi:UDP-N-acetylmuramyl pentapeptide phosphotransferase/UDP-N-acetylglucosamine-1-phosphate transferase
MLRHAAAVAALVCWVGCLLLIRLARHWQFGLDETSGEAQKKHRRPTPRSGGIALVLGVAAGVALLDAELPQHQDFALRIGAAALPLLAVGIWEDLRRHVAPLLRLGAGLVAAALAVWLCGASVVRADFAPADALLLAWPWLGAALALLAIAAMPHAVNMIDGFHGLAAMVCVLILAAIGYVALTLGDLPIVELAGICVGALFGFLFWNWPRGDIFLGDTGAYVLGFVLALLAILLVRRHPEVSPWFALLVLIYPSWELLFSMLRRRLLHRRPGMRADSRHLHHLIHRRLERALGRDANPNAFTAPYLWSLAAFSVGPAVLWWNRRALLALWSLLFVLAYAWSWRALLRRA